mmetsp:Transcript_57202/g.92659  ORF Transcript_57202/g.92659 Transcript_57202/m.92659 type:complete len:355 (-) Transcript_57202:239-1303(-)|eukprot:CAMPEP_0115141762 /NCGR_PEP_ID=MMETSP0227-20121206/59742_1 /TAXON_ID=89957 /ORGANISM="Polarella glacialis, Strain CCMP 1383" /LENGTH=354 /DNA_ID=CAMNT_0002550209 /DNA_START=44 /DNA_END=1108 /DNA_ORIENTATION=-
MPPRPLLLPLLLPQQDSDVTPVAPDSQPSPTSPKRRISDLSCIPERWSLRSHFQVVLIGLNAKHLVEKICKDGFDGKEATGVPWADKIFSEDSNALASPETSETSDEGLQVKKRGTNRSEPSGYERMQDNEIYVLIGESPEVLALSREGSKTLRQMALACQFERQVSPASGRTNDEPETQVASVTLKAVSNFQESVPPLRDFECVQNTCFVFLDDSRVRDPDSQRVLENGLAEMVFNYRKCGKKASLERMPPLRALILAHKEEASGRAIPAIPVADGALHDAFEQKLLQAVPNCPLSGCRFYADFDDAESLFTVVKETCTSMHRAKTSAWELSQRTRTSELSLPAPRSSVCALL